MELPLKFMDYILNYQKYFHVTYVMDYMAITFFYFPKIFLCNGGTRGIPLKFMDYILNSHTARGASHRQGPSERATDQPGNYIAIT